MRLTTKARFAVTAMIDIALYNNGRPVTLTQISQRQKISVAYLEQIFCKLRRAQLVRSMRGPGGGYHLMYPAEEISVRSIIDAVEEDIDARQCRGDGSCQGDAACLTHHLWEGLNEVTTKYLDGVTLASLIKDHEAEHGPISIPAVIPVKKRRSVLIH